jgi:putative acyl-CoA dehydrogenase
MRSWLDLALSSKYDPRDMPAPGKRGVTIGMSMTERQGGSDVRANTTFATPCDPSVTVIRTCVVNKGTRLNE